VKLRTGEHGADVVVLVGRKGIDSVVRESDASEVSAAVVVVFVARVGLRRDAGVEELRTQEIVFWRINIFVSRIGLIVH
jgi:hypothetical protein